MDAKNSLLDRIAQFIAGRVTAQSSGYEPYTPSDPESLLRALEPGDVLLIEGNQKVSAAIKYLTQSTWSHAALFVGTYCRWMPMESKPSLVEVNLGEGA